METKGDSFNHLFIPICEIRLKFELLSIPMANQNVMRAQIIMLRYILSGFHECSSDCPPLLIKNIVFITTS